MDLAVLLYRVVVLIFRVLLEDMSAEVKSGIASVSEYFTVYGFTR